jgi:hypothetical protein
LESGASSWKVADPAVLTADPLRLEASVLKDLAGAMTMVRRFKEHACITSSALEVKGVDSRDAVAAL